MIVTRRMMKMQNATSFVDHARTWGRSLEEREAMRTGKTISEARRVVARKTGVSPGTLENLRNGRLKSIGAHFYERLRTAVIAELHAEIGRLEHEIEITRQAGLVTSGDEVAKAQAALETARALIGR